MQLSDIFICDFRCIKTVQISLEDVTTLVGPNNAGKSTILRAIEHLLDKSSKFAPNDYPKDSVTDQIMITGRFDNLSEVESNDLATFLSGNNTLFLRKTGVSSSTGLSTTFEYGLDQAENGNPEKWERLSSSGMVKIQEHLPLVQFIPATLTIDSELGSTKSSMFTRIKSHLVTKLAVHLQEIEKNLHELFDSLDGGDARQIRDQFELMFSEELKYWGSTTTFDFARPSVSDTLSGLITMNLDDGANTSTVEKGHGIQRAMHMPFIRILTRLSREDVDGGKSLMLLVEEPELYLHPNRQREVRDDFYALANDGHTRIVTCSHSAVFVDMRRQKSIRRVVRDVTGSATVFPVGKIEDLDDQAKREFNLIYWMNPHRSELFFASMVIVVEGQTEVSLLPRCCEYSGINQKNVAYIDAGGKGNIKTFVGILNQFSIPYVVLHDQDPIDDLTYDEELNLDQKKTDQRSKDKRTFLLNTSIGDAIDKAFGHQIIVCPDFDVALGVSKSQIEKHGKGLAANQRFDKLEEQREPLPPEIQRVISELLSIDVAASVPGTY